MYLGTSHVSRTPEKRPFFLYRRPNSLMKYEIFKSNFQKIWEVGYYYYYYYYLGPVCLCTSHMRTQDTLSCLN